MTIDMIEHLKELRLIGFVEGIEEQRTLSSYSDLSFEERLSMLVEKERLRRMNIQLLQRLKNPESRPVITRIRIYAGFI